MRHHTQRQLVRTEDAVTRQIGHRDLGGGHQKETLLRNLEQIFLELWQLAGAAHALRIHQHGHVHFPIAMRGGV